MTRVGLIVNPIAGAGGPLALHGSDAFIAAAEPPVHAAQRAMDAVQAMGASPEWICGAGAMGEALLRGRGLAPRVVGTANWPSGAADTRAAAQAICAEGAELLLFAGGDGTARDVMDAVGERLPVLGIPAGVKLQSGCFGTSARAAGRLARSFLDGHARLTEQREVVDLDEAELARGGVAARLYGLLRTPADARLLQGRKSRSQPTDAEAAGALAAAVAPQLARGLHLIGPGSTTWALKQALGLDGSLLGVDLVEDGRLAQLWARVGGGAAVADGHRRPGSCDRPGQRAAEPARAASARARGADAAADIRQAAGPAPVARGQRRRRCGCDVQRPGASHHRAFGPGGAALGKRLKETTMKHEGELAGKVALITGAASGIGRATAALFARQGARVLVCDRDAAGGLATVAAIRAAGGEALFAEADVARADDCRRAVQQAVQAWGRLDVLFNNAGITRRANVVDTSEADWDAVMAVNVRSVFLMSKYAVPVMAGQGGGSIVNAGSGWGLVGGKDAVSYCAAKGAVVNMTRAMAVDHGPQRIRVNCVCPGDTDTAMLRHEAAQLGLPGQALVEAGAARPLQRVGQADEIAQVVLFLASERASFVTGSAYVVDGGGLAGSA